MATKRGWWFNDSIDGTESRDFIYGDGGDDVLHGNGGNDFLDGGDGNDTIYGDEGADEIYGRTGDDLVYGGDGEDQINGEKGNDRLYGGDDDDSVFGGEGADVVHGGNNDDSVGGGTGDDKLYGDSGRDFLDGGMGNNLIDGGTGIDTALFTVSGNNTHVVVQLGEPGTEGTATRYLGNTAYHYTDRLISIENVIGTQNDDTITGNSQANELRGADGDDVLQGGGGYDFLAGDFGADTYVWATAADMSTGTITGTGNIDRIAFDSQDTIDLTALDANTIRGGNQGFNLVNDFSGTAGELVVRQVSTSASGQMVTWVVSGDLNGDSSIDFNFAIQTTPGLDLTDTAYWDL